jgi:hypothetical protein
MPPLVCEHQHRLSTLFRFSPAKTHRGAIDQRAFFSVGFFWVWGGSLISLVTKSLVWLEFYSVSTARPLWKCRSISSQFPRNLNFLQLSWVWKERNRPHSTALQSGSSLNGSTNHFFIIHWTHPGDRLIEDSNQRRPFMLRKCSSKFPNGKLVRINIFLLSDSLRSKKCVEFLTLCSVSSR